ncbi:L-threonine 3-dehydrogenase like protein [Argiope bruennichi]|uniref:alcohol dehydrogenase n=1 Tax=Argiope bruennichi TaxID=94029 RepID=A0A8T0FWN5_ARGBR|nr:L-threonine 3-dehydrogenase like protein [Argiope bruennichi]
MAAGATGARIVFFGSHKQPSYVVETCTIPSKDLLKDGEILIKILISTICSSDIVSIDGKRELKPPCVLGHEGVGEVVYTKRFSNGLPAVSAGDRVVFTMYDNCEACVMCKSEMQECCLSKNRYGSCGLSAGTGLNGCFATHMVLKKGTEVVSVPVNVSDIVASPANCALSTMVHAVNFATSNSKLKQSVAIIQGANLMGLYGCALLHEAGFVKVFCHDISRERLRLVPRFGGIPVLVEKEYDNSHSQIEEGKADVVIDVSGKWDVIPYALHALCHRGIYIFVGTTYEENKSINIDTILNKCITIRGIQGYKSIHLKNAVDFLSKTAHKYPYESLISSPFPLQDFHSAVVLARTKRFGLC